MKKTKPIEQWARHPREWGAKNSASQLARIARDKIEKLGTCRGCGQPMRSRNGLAKWCSTKCRYEDTIRKNPDRVLAKARTLASCVRGAGKTVFIETLLRAALDRPCTYCGQIVTLMLASLDHATPFRGLRNTPMQVAFDRQENLQIICRRCNGMKGEMTDPEFRKLLEFLRTDPGLYAKVTTGLSQLRRFWGLTKGKKS